MDRIRDLASSFSTSRSHRKAVNDNAKSTTSSESVASDSINTTTAISFKFNSQSIQPTRSLQTTAQAQPTQDQAKSTSNTEACKEKKKKKKKKKKSGTSKKNKAAKWGASMERREADQKLFDTADAVINQNEVISGTGRELSLCMNEAARDILEANKYIERKDQETADINKRLEIMEVSFNEAKKHLERAQLLASQAVESGCWEQCKCDMKAQLHENISSITKDMKTSDLGTWSKEKTNIYLKDLLGTYFANEDTVHSRCIGRSIVSLAKRFVFHGNYDDEYATLLFHLANGRDYKKFLLKLHDQDHEAASRYPSNHIYRHLRGTRKTQTGKESAADIDKGVVAMIKDYADSISHEEMMGGSVPGFFPSIPSYQLDDILAQPAGAVTKCVVPLCDCEELEKGEFVRWTARLRDSLARKPYLAPGPVVETFSETIDGISEAAQHFGIDISLSCINDDSLPVIQFLYEEACYEAKSPEMTKKLQASAEKFGFRFGTCESYGKAGYHIVPAEMVNGKITMAMQQKCMQERMAVHKMIKDEVKTFMDQIWGNTLDESDKARKDQITDMMEWHASNYFSKNASKFLEENGSTFETCTPETAGILKHQCVMAAKQAVLQSYSQMAMAAQDLAAYKWEELKGSKAN